MKVTMCVCFNVTFKSLKSVSETYNIKEVDELQKVINFGQKCGLCMPYVEAMLRTGQVEFKLLG